MLSKTDLKTCQVSQSKPNHKRGKDEKRREGRGKEEEEERKKEMETKGKGKVVKKAMKSWKKKKKKKTTNKQKPPSFCFFQALQVCDLICGLPWRFGSKEYEIFPQWPEDWVGNRARQSVWFARTSDSGSAFLTFFLLSFSLSSSTTLVIITSPYEFLFFFFFFCLSWWQDQLEIALKGIMGFLNKTTGIAIYPGFDHKRGTGKPIVGPLCSKDIESLTTKSLLVLFFQISFFSHLLCDILFDVNK